MCCLKLKSMTDGLEPNCGDDNVTSPSLLLSDTVNNSKETELKLRPPSPSTPND